VIASISKVLVSIASEFLLNSKRPMRFAMGPDANGVFDA
jgi:hypothetical protein